MVKKVKGGYLRPLEDNNPQREGHFQKTEEMFDWFCLVVYNGISTFVGYLMPMPMPFSLKNSNGAI